MSYGNYGTTGTLGAYGTMCPGGMMAQPVEAANLVNFLRTLSPGILVRLQYDDQPPATGVFQGFENGAVILTNFNGFPGLVRIAPNKINAISPFVNTGTVPTTAADLLSKLMKKRAAE